MYVSMLGRRPNVNHANSVMIASEHVLHSVLNPLPRSLDSDSEVEVSGLCEMACIDETEVVEIR